jgi:transposase-like protein
MAVTTDGNNQLLPLAIAFAEGENGDSWYCFLERLKQMVVGDTKVFCRLLMTSKKVVKSVTEQHNGQMCIAGVA